MNKWILLAMLVSGVAFCQAQDLRQTEAARSACGAFEGTSPTTELHPNPEAGTATVYVIQIANFVGNCFGSCGFESRIGLDGKWVGDLTRNSFTRLDLAPGAHHLCAAWNAREKHLAKLVALHSLKVEAGQTYYFGLDMIGFTHDGGSVHYAMRALDEDEGRMLVSADTAAGTKP